MASDSYVIRGGSAGRERLRVLSRVMAPTTQRFMDRVGIPTGASCLDVGCGGGDVTLELARRVGPTGRVVGVDLDAEKVELARAEAAAAGVGNVEFRTADVREAFAEAEYDVVYCRFVLSHLEDAAGCLVHLRSALKPGGVLLVEDLDFRGHFCYPTCAAFDRYVELYTRAVRQRGADPEIGPRLPGLLRSAGFSGVAMDVVQPNGFEGEVKLITPLTMEAIADSLVGGGLASESEVEELVRELWGQAEDAEAVVGLPRVVQVWGVSGQD